MSDQPQQPEPPGRPRGKAIRLTDEQIEAMAQVDAGDAIHAEDLWRRYAPRWATELLRADEQAGRNPTPRP